MTLKRCRKKYEELQDAIGESERGKTRKSKNCRYDESPSQTNYQQPIKGENERCMNVKNNKNMKEC